MPMDPASLGLIVGQLQNVGNQGGKYFARRRERKWALQDYERQMEDDRANWDRDRNAAISDRNFENDYNRPDRVMERLKQAKLNPALIYGGGGASYESASSETPSTQGAPRVRDTEAFGNDIAGSNDMAQMVMAAEQQRMNRQMLEQQQQLIIAQTLKVISETKGIDLDNQLFTDTYQDLVRKVGVDIGETETNIEGMRVKMDVDRQNIRESGQRIEESKARMEKIKTDIKFTLDENQRQKIRSALENDKITEETKLIVLDVVNYELKKLQVEANTAKTEAEKDRINAQIELLQKEIQNFELGQVKDWLKILWPF